MASSVVRPQIVVVGRLPRLANRLTVSASQSTDGRMTELRMSPLGAWSPDLEAAPPPPVTPIARAPRAPRPPLANPTELAAHLAARLCHDFISPASAIMSGVDLLDDPTTQDMREDAINLISTSAKKLADMLSFARVAFGASAAAETFEADALRQLTQSVFTHVRPSLDWQVEIVQMQKPPARALLNMAQIGASALPMGGVAVVRAVQNGADIDITVDAKGPRARVRPEVLAGLRGEPAGEGLGGHWVQAFYLSALVHAADGVCSAEVSEDRVLISASIPNAN